MLNKLNYSIVIVFYCVNIILQNNTKCQKFEREKINVLFHKKILFVMFRSRQTNSSFFEMKLSSNLYETQTERESAGEILKERGQQLNISFLSTGAMIRQPFHNCRDWHHATKQSGQLEKNLFWKVWKISNLKCSIEIFLITT